jgi:predicted DNA-binding protein YlxM (UPF0122 family)
MAVAKAIQDNGFYSIERLKQIFRVSDDRTIKACFGDKLIIRNQVEGVPAMALQDRIGFCPDEPFLTAPEVCEELNIDESQLMALMRANVLPVFKLVNAKGSCRLFLKRDIENSKKTVIEYCNNPLLYSRSFSLMRTTFLTMAQLDFRFKRRYFKKEQHLQIFEKYFVELRSAEEIASELEITANHVRNTINKCMHFLGQITEDVENLHNHYTRVIEENLKLQQQLATYKPIIDNFNEIQAMPVFSEGEKQTISEAMARLDQEIVPSQKLLSVRTYNGLNNFFRQFYPNRVRTWKMVAETPISTLQKVRNIGTASIDEICTYLMNEIKIYPNTAPVQRKITHNNVLEYINHTKK